MSCYNDFLEFASELTKFKSLIGLDLGTKTIGIAVQIHSGQLQHQEKQLNEKNSALIAMRYKLFSIQQIQAE